MFCDASHNFWDDEKKFDKYSTKFAEKQLQRERTLLNLDFSYQPTIPGTKQGTFQSSKYRTFLSELAKGSFLKKNGCTETSQCYEGYMNKNFTSKDTQLSYSQILAVKNISGTYLLNKSERGSQLNQLAERLMEEPDHWKVFQEQKTDQQDIISRNVEEYRLHENDILKPDSLEKTNWNPKLYKTENRFYDEERCRVKQHSSVDKYIENCYECIKKISESFDDILNCSKNYTERSRYAKTVLRKTEFDIFDRGTNKSISDDSTSVTGHFLNTTHANNGSQNRMLFRNNSENLNNNFSTEEINDYSYYMRTDRYCSLKNLYSSSEIVKSKKYSKEMREQHQKNLKFELMYDPVIKEDEYREWLKRNNLLNYTHYCKTNPSETSRLTRHKEIPINISTITCEVPLQSNSLFYLNNEFQQNQAEDYREGKFMDVQCYNIHELIIYEHLVVMNFLTFFTSYFSVRRIRRLSVNDHIIQIIFFAICYGVFMIVKNSGITMLIN